MYLARSIFEKLASGPLPEWGTLAAVIKIVTLEPGNYLFRTGDSHPFVYCVRQGVLKLVYDTAEGKEWIKGFSADESFFASAGALSGGHASFSAIAIEPTQLERLDYRVIQQLADAHMGWQKMLGNAFQLYGARKEKREKELLTLSAEERYCLFIAEQPQLRERIPQQDLARYLGVTPVALSRIKRRHEKSL